MRKDNLWFQLFVCVLMIGIGTNALASVEDSLRVEKFFADIDTLYIQYGDRAFEKFITEMRDDFQQVDSLFQGGRIDTSQIVDIVTNKEKSWVARLVGMNVLRNASRDILLQVGQEIAPDTAEPLELRKGAVIFLGADTAQATRDIVFDIASEPELWFTAMEMLASMQDERVLPLGIDSLKSTNFIRKIRAVMILTDLKNLAAYEPLISLYNELDSLRIHSQNMDTVNHFMDIEARIITALGSIGNPQALDFLINKAQNEKYYFSMNAIESLGELGSTDAVPVLIQIMTQPNPEMNKISVFKRLACAQSLAKIGDRSQEVLDAIEEAIDIVHEDCIEEGIGSYVEEQMWDAYKQLKKEK